MKATLQAFSPRTLATLQTGRGPLSPAPTRLVSGLTYQLVDGLGRDSANLTWQPLVKVGGTALAESAVYPSGDVVATLADVVSYPASPALEVYEFGQWWPLALQPRTNLAPYSEPTKAQAWTSATVAVCAGQSPCWCRW